MAHDNRILIVDRLLTEVANELDIPPSKYKQAVERYSSVGSWLQDGTYTGSTAQPTIYPQGSFLLGTVVRPVKDGAESDYDIDLVCCIDSNSLSPAKLKTEVGDRLCENANYRRMLDEEGKRCWTLKYAENDDIGFHLDVLPSIPGAIVIHGEFSALGQLAVSLTDKKAANEYVWGTTNPAGYARWFEARQRRAFATAKILQKAAILAMSKGAYASVEEVPDQLVRTPLQRMVQILKRHRDVRFSGHENMNDRPISIIITTLAAQAYAEESSLYEAMASFLDTVSRFQETGIIRCEYGNWVIENPTNPGENFADRWNDQGSKKPDAFFEWVNWVQEDLDDLLNCSSPTLKSVLTNSFGSRVATRVANGYSGPAPGEQQPPVSGFGRVVNKLLRFDVSHRKPPRWHVSPTGYRVSVRGKYFRNGFRPTAFNSNSRPLKKGLDLEFEASTNIAKPYSIHWQVVNTGTEAERMGQLRGEFYDSNPTGKQRTESTKYSGMHWVEAFVVKDNVCVARSGEFIVNIE